MARRRCFIPEVENFMPELGRTLCEKPLNHVNYKSPKALTLEDLPDHWRSNDMLEYLKLASRRVVHLSVLKESTIGVFYGSGYLTFHPIHGALVHTSKHVVNDPFAAERTIVRLFYDEENTAEQFDVITKFVRETRQKIKGESVSIETYFSDLNVPQTCSLFMSLGNSDFFQSVNASDYTCFSCNLPIHELFSEQEIDKMSDCFSWFNFNAAKLLLYPPKEIYIAVISHPHGEEKAISFGRMNRICSINPALYDAATCSGSSGAPIIRLKSDEGHIKMGQFLHHGHNQDVLNKAMGMVRPPWAFPYLKCLDTESTLSNMIDILYEPIFYWTLFICDLLQVETTFRNIQDVFAYTSSLSALLFTVDCTLFKILSLCLCLHLLITWAILSCQTGLYNGFCSTMCTVISMFMFPVAWFFLYSLPQRGIREIVAIIVWTIILYFERYFRLSVKFRSMAMGSFAELIQRIGMQS